MIQTNKKDFLKQAATKVTLKLLFSLLINSLLYYSTYQLRTLI